MCACTAPPGPPRTRVRLNEPFWDNTITMRGVRLISGYTALTPSLALKILGVVYAIVAVLGFVMLKGGDGVMFGIAMNMADHWLHVALAIVLLYAGFGLPAVRTATA